MFETVDGWRTDGQAEHGVIRILFAHIGAYDSGKLK